MIKKTLPAWLHKKFPKKPFSQKINLILSHYGLSTVCEEARCPNRPECYEKKCATFLALGHQCTRSCSFCSISHNSSPYPPDPKEPLSIAKVVKKLNLLHVVITMVTRDDLKDGGAFHMAQIIKSIKKNSPKTSIEVLTSDFSGNLSCLDIVLEEKPDVFNHNIETTRLLTKKIRDKAQYDQSLFILSHAKKRKKTRFIKSGLMVGFGEKKEDIYNTIDDLYEVGCDIITIGQYLQSSSSNIPVKKYVSLSSFKDFSNYAKKKGIKKVFSAPFVRSSYFAAECLSS